MPDYAVRITEFDEADKDNVFREFYARTGSFGLSLAFAVESAGGHQYGQVLSLLSQALCEIQEADSLHGEPSELHVALFKAARAVAYSDLTTDETRIQ